VNEACDPIKVGNLRGLWSGTRGNQKHITVTADGLDYPRATRIVIQLAAKLAYEDVNAPVVGLPIPVGKAIKDLIA